MKIRWLWVLVLIGVQAFSMGAEENPILRQLSNGFNELVSADNLTQENFATLMETIQKLRQENHVLKEQLNAYKNNETPRTPDRKRKKLNEGIGHIPDNVVKFPEPIYNQIDFELKKKFGASQIYVSPSKPKTPIKPQTSNIYSMTAVMDAQDAHIEPGARIDASTLVTGEITDQNLHEALWNAEKILLEIIEADSSIVHQAVYVGATKRSLGERASEHFKDLRKNLKQEQVMSPLKEQVLVRALLSGYHVRN